MRSHDILIESMPLWTWNSETFIGVGFCSHAVWSRKSRRDRDNVQRISGVSVGETNDERASNDMAFGFQISVMELDKDPISGTKAIVRWLKGHDSVLFESFCGMLRRSLTRCREALDQDQISEAFRS